MPKEKIHFQTPKERRLKRALRELVEAVELSFRPHRVNCPCCKRIENACKKYALDVATTKAKLLLEKDM